MTTRSYLDWQAPLPDDDQHDGGRSAEEIALGFDAGRLPRLLILPALFDEANKMRHQTAEIMHRLNLSGIDCFLPDLPGCNESLQPLETQTLAGWRKAAVAAAEQFRATHVLAIRGSALLAPANLPGWRYAPTTGARLLRSLLRARTLASRESGIVETIEELSVIARQHGIELAGWHLGAAMFSQLEAAKANVDNMQAVIDQADIGGPGLWLRAEPGDAPEQADALAALVAMGMLDS